MTIGFQPNLLDDWHTNSPAPTRPPQVIGELGEVDSFVHYAYAMPFIHTPDAVRVRRAIEEIQSFNATRPLGARRLVVIDGPAHFGKTTLVLHTALAQARAVWAQEERQERRPHSIPWAYVNATSGGEGRSVAGAIAGFCHLPPPSSRPTLAQYLQQLAHTSKPMGLHTVFVDDIHALRSFGGRDARSLADSIKALVTGLPLTLVLAGIELRRHPLFVDNGRDRITAAQLLNRSHWVRLRPWPSHDEAGHIHEDWLRLIAHVSEYVALPRGPKQNRLHTRAAIDYLVSGVDGRPGTAIEWLLRAAAWAATNDKPLDRSALVATKPGAR
ncbi:AAA family ATPase [Propioniciclava sinopodophylli]|uniref:AAA family ATPase n=1 Tax=Propioniciclava sinopodophylli TaxID=1837344 RepID=UPI00249306FB|nr:AAA family ATPase [Propioniciclava sinopodophylli]